MFLNARASETVGILKTTNPCLSVSSISLLPLVLAHRTSFMAITFVDVIEETYIYVSVNVSLLYLFLILL